MTTMTTTGKPRVWLPDGEGKLVVQPVTNESIAIRALGTVGADEATNAYRVPIVTDDPSATWVAEGEEIAPSAASLAEDADYFHKIAGLTVASQELISDASPNIAQVVLNGLGRDIAHKLDAAFFGKRGSDTKAPRGLNDITGVNAINAGAKFTSLDPFIDAVYAAEAKGATLAAFVANPADALTVAKIKDRSDSQRSLLAPDPTQAGARLISGVPLMASPAVARGTIWGLPQERVLIAVRDRVTLTKDVSAYFTSDRVAIKATMRVTFLYPHPGAIQKITAA